MTDDELRANLAKLHTTALGIVRIKRNLAIDTEDVVGFCADKISSPNAVIKRKGKNWYIDSDGDTIVVNAHSFTIITAHKK